MKKSEIEAATLAGTGMVPGSCIIARMFATSTVTYLTVVSKVHTLGGPVELGCDFSFLPSFLQKSVCTSFT